MQYKYGSKHTTHRIYNILLWNLKVFVCGESNIHVCHQAWRHKETF